MVLDLLALAAIPTAVGASEAVHQQRLLDEEAESDERQAPFYLDVYCDAKSRKRDEVHGAMVVLREGKLWLWPKDKKTGLPRKDAKTGKSPHPFTGFYLPFPTQDLPHRPIPAPPILGLVSTIPHEDYPLRRRRLHRRRRSSSTCSSSDTDESSARPRKPKLNWIYADRQTHEICYGPRVKARHHIVGPWDWTEDDEQGLTLNGEESLVVVEEESGGYGWKVYWDKDDDRLKRMGIEKEKRVLRCSLERRLCEEGKRVIEIE